MCKKLERILEMHASDRSFICDLKKTAKACLLEKLQIKPLHKVATFLCQKFRSLQFLSDPEKYGTYQLARSLIRELTCDDNLGSYFLQSKCEQEHNYSNPTTSKKQKNIKIP